MSITATRLSMSGLAAQDPLRRTVVAISSLFLLVAICGSRPGR